MISERKFSTAFTSFWNQELPRAEAFLRRVNLSSEHYTNEIETFSSTHPDRRAIVNELGYRLFKHSNLPPNTSKKTEYEIAESVRNYISRLSIMTDNRVRETVSDIEICEARAIADSLSLYFDHMRYSKMHFSPEFLGCGMLQTVRGDILADHTLIEIKAGDRTFRQTDLRQLLTYCALNFESHSYILDELCLLNPRRGIVYLSSISNVAIECSGKSYVDLFGDIIEFLSSDTNSK